MNASYAVVCTSCGTRYVAAEEQFQSGKYKCPRCGSPKARRLGIKDALS